MMQDASGKFRSIQTLRCRLKRSFPDSLCDVPKEDIEFGYIYPGHGAQRAADMDNKQ